MNAGIYVEVIVANQLVHTKLNADRDQLSDDNGYWWEKKNQSPTTCTAVRAVRCIKRITVKRTAAATA